MMRSAARRHELAIAAVCEIAAAGRRLSQREITGRLDIANTRALENDLQALVKAGVLRGQKGMQGGYEVVRSPTTFDDVLAAVDPVYATERELLVEDAVHSRIRDAMRRITIGVRT